jgi:mannitol-specific phosphotransferase system IIBC component
LYEKAEKKYDNLFKKRDRAMVATIIEFAIFAFALLVFFGLVVTNIRTRMQNNKLKTNLTQESIDRAIVMQEMQKLMAEIDTKNSSQNDGFLKFVSESREAAFKYIEEVQLAIKEFDNHVGPVVKHYKETGKVLERKPSELVKELTSAYDKLMESMPKEESV